MCFVALLAGACRPSERSVRADVVDLVDDHRVALPRFAGGFRHAPCTPAGSDALVAGVLCAGRLAPSRAATAIQLDLTRLSGGDASPALLRLQAVFDLQWTDPATVTGAVHALESVARSEASAAAWSDLAAAYLIRAETAQDARDLLRSLEAANRALATEPERPEPLFNRAVALELLFLDSAAVGGWDDYLALDSTSGWAAEARVRRRVLVERPAPAARWAGLRHALAHEPSDSVIADAVALFPGATLEYALDEALRGWGGAVQAGDAAAAAVHLSTARRLGDRLAADTGDRLVADAVRAVDSARGSVGGTAVLAAAHAAYPPTGAYGPDDPGASLGEGHPLVAEAWLAQSLTLFYANDYDAARAVLSRLAATARDHGWGGIAAEAADRLGLILEVTTDFAAALRAREEALALADSGAVGTAVRAQNHMKVARLTGLLRTDEEAWVHRYRALRMTRGIARPIDLYAVYSRMADDATIDLDPAIQILFQDVAVRATLGGDHGFACAALLVRARLHHALGHAELASADLAAAEREARAMPIERGRDDMLQLWNLEFGVLRASSEPEAALARLEAAAVHFHQTDYSFQEVRVAVATAAAHIAAGRVAEAERAWGDALREIERRGDAMEEDLDRARILDDARPLLDRIVAFHLARGDTAAAFDRFEETRARSLLGGSAPGGTGSARPLSQAEIRRRLPDDVALLTFTVLPDRVLVWTLTPGALRLHAAELAIDGLEASVQRLRASLLSGRGGETRAAASALHEALLAPAMRDLPEGARLVIVPDRLLHAVPFGALHDAGSDRFLAERFSVSIAPSASALIRGLERSDGGAGLSGASALVVGNPDFDRTRFRLPDLPNAEREATRVSLAYGVRGDRLSGAAATPAAFLARAPGVALVHFAGHAVVNPTQPSRSFLLMAPSPGVGGSGALYADEIAARRFDGTRLVVLSACDTSTGRLSPGDGPASLASAFLSAGVPNVVASLWAVDDRGTADFFEAYHRRLVETGSPAEALRDVQMTYIRSGDAFATARIWSAFELFGIA